jgi:hypothetical protein
MVQDPKMKPEWCFNCDLGKPVPEGYFLRLTCDRCRESVRDSIRDIRDRHPEMDKAFKTVEDFMDGRP